MNRLAGRRLREAAVGWACALLAALVPVAADASRDHRILADMYVHLDRGRASAELGRWREAVAQSDAILLPGAVRYEIRFEGRAIHAESRARQALDEATAMWSDAVGDVVFEEASVGEVTFMAMRERLAGRSMAPVEVVIVFSPDGRRGSASVGGHIVWQRWVGPLDEGGFGVRVQARIDVRTELPGSRVPLTLSQMRHVIAHEIGHLLGLDDSPRIGDVMGPLDLNRPATEPSIEEVLALRRLRAEARHIRLRSLLAALSEGGRYNTWRVASR